MVAIYGVSCKVCDEFISLGQSEKRLHLSTFQLAPTEPILCLHCGSFYVYKEWELIDARRSPLSDRSNADFYPASSQLLR
ncbi:hypothetical protein HDF16_005324 [Granulicella aggregans]|uniref:Uncharacterized protein n=1 Tax=Granulicella aggregans TaxID=474949 RepID=A0A7W8E5W5_9BACT|nr:hypothetical protein [Granulicella aggregans]